MNVDLDLLNRVDRVWRSAFPYAWEGLVEPEDIDRVRLTVYTRDGRTVSVETRWDEGMDDGEGGYAADTVEYLA